MILPKILGKPGVPVRRIISFAAAMTLALLAAVPALADNDRDYMPEGPRTNALFAHVVFCVNYPGECKPNTGPYVVKFDAKAERLLHAVNISVNRSIRSVDEGIDSWRIDVEAGDCEDYALTKRNHLIAAGMSARAMRIAIATTFSGVGHAALVVRTDKGDLVLDSRTDRIRNWRSVDLHWLMIQSSENPKIWYEVPK